MNPVTRITREAKRTADRRRLIFLGERALRDPACPVEEQADPKLDGGSALPRLLMRRKDDHQGEDNV